MEKLFHYAWKHRLFPLRSLATTDGRSVDVLDTGLQNHDAGPDFFNAKVIVDGTLWVGNVELHLKSSHWYQHGHDRDAAYDNTILHVVCCADTEVFNSRGQRLAQMEMPIPEYLSRNYTQLLREDRYPRCHKIIPQLPRLAVHSWMSALQAERLERKTTDILTLVDELGGAWEDACFRTLARNFGFGVNGDAFAMWAKSLPLKAVGHHRDDAMQVEALFLGQSGLLDPAAAPHGQRERMEADTYYQTLRREYKYLAHKFSLTPMDGTMWKFLRLRPQNFPYVRLSQLASLYCGRKAGMSQLLDCDSVEQLREALSSRVSEYWQTHYLFGVESEKSEKRMSKSSIDVLMVNTVIPMLFAYGRHKHNETLTERAIDFLETLKPEDNNIVRLWRECGLTVAHAGDSQALIQLKKEYCDRHKCLTCRFGYYFIKSDPGFLRDDGEDADITNNRHEQDL